MPYCISSPQLDKYSNTTPRRWINPVRSNSCYSSVGRSRLWGKKTLRRLANHWALRSTDRSARAWHRIFNHCLSKWCWGWGGQPKGGSIGLCVLSAPGSAPSQCPVLPQSAGAHNKSKIGPVCSMPRQVVSYSPETAAFQELADTLFAHLLPTWSPE